MSQPVLCQVCGGPIAKLSESNLIDGKREHAFASDCVAFCRSVNRTFLDACLTVLAFLDSPEPGAPMEPMRAAVTAAIAKAEGLKEETQSQAANELVDGHREARKNQLHQLVDAAEYFNSDLTQVIARDEKGKLLMVAVVAMGGYARDLEKFLKQISKREDSLAQGRRPTAAAGRKKKVSG